uniref:Vacuolar protein sorting-associated protein VTA1 n=1 Tax=Steinernema glaseri TaxID=37863 RepID=A0A1I7YX34_9BILA
MNSGKTKSQHVIAVHIDHLQKQLDEARSVLPKQFVRSAEDAVYYLIWLADAERDPNVYKEYLYKFCTDLTSDRINRYALGGGMLQPRVLDTSTLTVTNKAVELMKFMADCKRKMSPDEVQEMLRLNSLSEVNMNMSHTSNLTTSPTLNPVQNRPAASRSPFRLEEEDLYNDYSGTTVNPLSGREKPAIGGMDTIREEDPSSPSSNEIAPVTPGSMHVDESQSKPAEVSEVPAEEATEVQAEIGVKDADAKKAAKKAAKKRAEVSEVPAEDVPVKNDVKDAGATKGQAGAGLAISEEAVGPTTLAMIGKGQLDVLPDVPCKSEPRSLDSNDYQSESSRSSSPTPRFQMATMRLPHGNYLTRNIDRYQDRYSAIDRECINRMSPGHDLPDSTVITAERIREFYYFLRPTLELPAGTPQKTFLLEEARRLREIRIKHGWPYDVLFGPRYDSDLYDKISKVADEENLSSSSIYSTPISWHSSDIDRARTPSEDSPEKADTGGASNPKKARIDEQTKMPEGDGNAVLAWFVKRMEEEATMTMPIERIETPPERNRSANRENYFNSDSDDSDLEQVFARTRKTTMGRKRDGGKTPVPSQYPFCERMLSVIERLMNQNEDGDFETLKSHGVWAQLKKLYEATALKDFVKQPPPQVGTEVFNPKRRLSGLKWFA